MKNYFKKFPSRLTAAVMLFNLNVSAETVADSEGGVKSETLKVTVTRTGEGIEVVTPDGRHVLLKNDQTWEYLELAQLPAEESAVLDVVNVKELSNACDVGFKLTNNQQYKIKSLVPSFSAYTRDQVLFDTQSKSFNSIKPTRSQYQKVRFIGITCPEISHIKLLGADRCTMGPFTKFDSGEGECLKRIHIRENDLIKVLK
ncbi:MAG: hypothetical protein WBN43_16455 [Thiogranum sp.]